VPKYRSEDKDDYSVPPEEHVELSVKETMNRRGFDSFSQVADRSFKTGRCPACCTCGAMVEPDGDCPHGNPSIMKKKKFI